MSSSLVIRVRFLDGRYHGRLERGRAQEWPPSPLRMFQALLAGAAPRWFDGEIERRERPAFEWLEQQPPPTITTPATRCGTPLLTYVPNNNRGDTDAPLEKGRTAKIIEPTLFSTDRVTEYHYELDPIDETAAKHARIICDVARHIRCLGWGIDLAVGNGEIVPDAAPTPANHHHGNRITFRPASEALATQDARRVPAQGTLASLEAVHAGKLGRFAEPGILTLDNRQPIFRQFIYTSAPHRPFVAFRFLDDDDDTVAYATDSLKALTGHLRHLAAAACAGRVNQDVINGTILGHPADGPRLSILPVPSIGHANIDGRIRRVIFVEPFGVSGDLCRELSIVMDQRRLTFEGDCPCTPSRLERLRGKDGVISSYTATSRTWASVTPVLLPGHNARRKSTAIKAMQRACGLIAKSLMQAEIRTPAEFEISRVPFWPGSRHVRDYHPRDKLVNCPRFHVKITFEQPVTGPLSIGAGRHVGFGTLAAMKDPI